MRPFPNEAMLALVDPDAPSLPIALAHASNLLFNVKDYGALGAGTDDSRAIVEAVRAANVAGGTVFFPEGAYVLSLELKISSNVAIVGAGRRITTTGARGTVVRRGFTGTMFNFSGANGAHNTGQHLEGLTIDGMDAAGGFTGTAVDVRYTSGMSCRRLEVLGNIGRAIHLAQTWDSDWDTVWVRRCGSLVGTIAAIDIDNTATDTTDRARFTSVHCESNYYKHVHSHGTGGFGAPPRFLTFLHIKCHDFPTGADRLTVPVFDMEDTDYSSGYALQLQNTLGPAARFGGALNQWEGKIVQLGVAAATELVVLNTNASRNWVRVLMDCVPAPTVAKLNALAGSQNNGVLYHTQGPGTAVVDAGTLNVMINFQDGFFNFVTGTPQLGSASRLHSGAGVPAAGLGNNGDFYFRSGGGVGTALYFKIAGAWNAIA